MKIAITGAGGFIGSRIRNRFKDHVIIQRNHTTGDVVRIIRQADVVINLAGAPIIKRWTNPYKQVLRQSRLSTTAKVARALNSTDGKRLLISASATGIYPQGKACDETCHHHADDFLGKLAADWEAEALKYRGPVAIFRLGMVLGPEGGALSKMLLPFRLGMGGSIGSGRMMMSWIDAEDLMDVFAFVMERGLSGIFNAVSPHPVSNREFTQCLAKALRRPAFLPVPPLILRLLYGQAASVMTGSWEVYPARLLMMGYEFRYPDLSASLDHLLAGKSR